MPTRLFPMVSAEDFAESVSFYAGLGGIEAYRFPEEDPVFVTLRFGDSELGIGALRGASIHGRAQRPATGHRVELCLYVDDVDATAAQAASVVTPPQDMPWGERIAYIEDPDGNLVMLAHQESPKETSVR